MKINSFYSKGDAIGPTQVEGVSGPTGILQLPSHIAPYLTSLEWRRCAVHQIEILKTRIKSAREELKLWEDELKLSDKALKVDKK